MKKKRLTPKSSVSKTIYLDFASATPISPAVSRALQKADKVFGNPGALHEIGIAAKKLIEESRALIAKMIKARGDELCFTSSATEANNLALLGVVRAFTKEHPTIRPHIIVSSIEHPSVLEVARTIERDGVVDVTYLAVNEKGIVDLKLMKESLRKETILVSIMYANNEIGTLQPLHDISKIIRHFKKTNTGTLPSSYPLFHTDAAQAFQYVPISMETLHVDLLTMSSGKIYGPRGVAFLYIRKGTPVDPVLYGGGQERELRPGTLPTSLIASFAAAVVETEKIRVKESARLTILRDYTFLLLRKEIRDVLINGDESIRLPNNVSLSIPGIESDYLLLELSAKGIYVSSKSACDSDSGDTSHVILAIGGSPTDGNLRLSFGRTTTKEEITKTIRVLSAAVLKWRTWQHANKR